MKTKIERYPAVKSIFSIPGRKTVLVFLSSANGEDDKVEEAIVWKQEASGERKQQSLHLSNAEEKHSWRVQVSREGEIPDVAYFPCLVLAFVFSEVVKAKGIGPIKAMRLLNGVLSPCTTNEECCHKAREHLSLPTSSVESGNLAILEKALMKLLSSDWC